MGHEFDKMLIGIVHLEKKSQMNLRVRLRQDLCVHGQGHISKYILK